MPAQAGIHAFLKITDKTEQNQKLTKINENSKHSDTMK